MSQHSLYMALGRSDEERCRAYRELLQAHLEAELIRYTGQGE